MAEQDLHNLWIGGLLVFLTIVVGGRNAMLPDRALDMPGGDERGMSFSAHEIGSETHVPGAKVPRADFSFYLKLHEARDLRVQTGLPAMHQCRG